MPFQNPTNLGQLSENNLGILLYNGTRQAGQSVAVGDVNGDGKADMLIGAPGYDFDNGAAYLVLGSCNPEPVDLENITPGIGIILSGGSGSAAGTSVALGDVNNDGKADMLIGTDNGDEVYLVLGSTNPMSLDLGNMTTGTGVILSGGSGQAGQFVALGDVNGDGKADMLIGGGNEVYLVFGSASPTAVDLGNMTASTGVFLHGGAGQSVALGDVNGDGKADMLIGAPFNNQAYLVFGSSNPVSVHLGRMSSSIGVLLNNGSGYAGWSMALGDVNGDGKADMLIGTYKGNQAYLVFGSATPTDVDLGNMTTGTGLILSDGSGNAGWSVALGDVNGDGKADMLIGAPLSNQAYLVFGSATPTPVDLENMPSSTGVMLSGGSGNAGNSVALGDVNGDGKADMLIGAPFSNQAYLVYGGPQPEPVTSCSSLTNLNKLGSGSLALTGVQLTGGSGSAGQSVALGDVNGDGKADMLIGAYIHNQTYLVFGSASPAEVDLETMASSTGVILSGGREGAGLSVALGDVNGDGKADMLIGAPLSNQAYLVFGSATPTPVDLENMPSSTGVMLSGGSGNAGQSVALGDVNGDGKADMLIGAPNSNQTYLVFGSAIPTDVDLGHMSASTGLTLSGGSGGAGQSVALGDVNGDGKADMLIGAPGAFGSNGGEAYLVFGSASPTAVDLGNMTASAGILLSGGREGAGWSVALGDVNGDRKADMLIGTEDGNQAYLVFGSANPMSVDLGNITASTGVLLSDRSGYACTSVALGDVNGDDKADMLLGSASSGQAYLVFGSASPTTVDLGSMTASIGMLMSGSFGGEVAFSVALGDMNGDGKADMLIGVSDDNTAYLVLGSQTPWFSSVQTNSTYTPGEHFQAINSNLGLDENNLIISASAQISENYQQGDYLEIFSNQLPANITIEPFNVETGALMLKGTATAYQYQQALDNVYYFSNTTNINNSPRTITFQANDGMICGISNQFSHTIYINATATSAPTPTTSPSRNFTPSQLGMLIALPIGGFFLLALVFSLYLYRRYQERHEFDEDAFEDIEAQPLLIFSSFSDTISNELHEESAAERNASDASVSSGERLYQQALRCDEGEEKKGFLEQAITHGHIAAQIELAQLYERGLISGQAQASAEGDITDNIASLNKAVKYLLDAEAQGSTEAAYHLPRIYLKLAQAYQAVDVASALSYYYKAIAAGYFEAQASLAQWLAEGFKLERPILQTQLKSHAYGVYTRQADANKDKPAALELLGKAQQTDAFNRSLLHLAVLYGCDYCIKALIKQGASVSQLDASGKTPLDIAKQQGSYQLITLLEEERVFEQNNAKNEARFQELLHQLQSSLTEEEGGEEDELDTENQEELLQAQAQELRRRLLDITELDQLLDSREALREEAQALDDYREKAQRDILIDLVKRLKTPAQMLAKHTQKQPSIQAALKKTRKHLTFLCKHIQAAKKHFTLDDNASRLELGMRTILALLNNLQAYYQSFLDQLNVKRTQIEQLALFAPKAVIHAAGEEFRFRHLKLEAQQKLIGQTGERDNQHGIHEVKEYNGVHYKLQPYAPGVEYMVNSLAEIIAGQGTSPTALINISYRDNYIYQASKTVIGVNLEHIVLCHPELIEKIDARNFSEIFTLDLITDPQDGKADNRMARVYLKHTGSGNAAEVERLRLVGIDNDIAFADPVIKQHRGEHKDKHYINVKNILYFFPQMVHEIHPEFRQHFLSHSPEVIIIQWLEALAKKNEEYQALLEQGVLTEEQLAGLQLPIKLVPGLALKLKNKIQKMQEVIREQPHITHKQLLSHIEPVVQKYYQAIQEKEPNPWRATFKLYKAAVASVEDKLSLETRISSRHRLMTELAYHHSDQDAFEDNRTQTIQAAMEEFITAINLPAVDNPEQESVSGYIGKLYQIEHLVLTNDSLLARITLPELVQRFENIKTLTIRDCQRATIERILLTLLKNPQLTLRLGNGTKVSAPKDWLRISQECKHFILLVGNLELNISEEEPEEILKRCEEAGVATEAIRQFMRLLSKQEKKGASATGSSNLSHYSTQRIPKTLFFPSPKQSGNNTSSNSSQARSANDKF